MTDATKAKLRKWIDDDFVLDMLEASKILYPYQVTEASDSYLKRAGLNDAEVAKVRAKLPKAAEVNE